MKDKTIEKNVIPFPRHSQGAQAQSKEERLAALSEKQFEQSKARERRVIEAKIDKKPMVQLISERIRLANNLWRILAEVRPLASTKQILHAAGQGHGTDSTKRLRYFALDPDLPDSTRDKRAGILAKKIGVYVRIVSEAARLSGKDESILIQQLVDGTWYSPSQADIDNVDEDINAVGWVDVQTAMHTAATRISSKYDLPRFFKLVRDLGILDHRAKLETRFDLLDQRTDRSPKQWDLQETPLPALVRTNKLPPRPSVYLGEIRVSGDMPCTLHLSPVLLSVGNTTRNIELRERRLEARFGRPSVKGVATPVLQAWLELIPLGRQNNVTPVLCLKSHTYIASAEQFTQLAPFGGDEWRLGEVIGEFEGPIEQGSNYVDTYADQAAICLPEASAELGLEAEFRSPLGAAYDSSLHSRSAVRGLWVGPFDGWAKTCLSKPVFTSEYSQRKPEVEDIGADAFTFFPRDTMAALLERSLFYGPETARLDDLLDQKASILTRELEASIEKARARRRERLDELRRESRDRDQKGNS